MSEGYCDHLAFTEQTCPDCGLDVDAYGNTEAEFIYCSFPNCGCDGARLCMAAKPSEKAMEQNVEGMWSGKTAEQRAAVFSLLGDITKEKEHK